MKLTRNRKQLVATAISITATIFMLAAYASLDRVPLSFVVLYIIASFTDGVLWFLGYREEKRVANLIGEVSQ